MDEKTSRKVCQLIAGMIVSDDELDASEEAFIERLLAKCGVAAGDRRRLFPIVDSEDAARELASLPQNVQTYAFNMMVAAAAADGKIVPKERAMLEAVAQAVYIAPQRVQEYVDKALYEAASDGAAAMPPPTDNVDADDE